MTLGPALGLGGPERRPLISVIMANYRGAGHIAAALTSLLSQSLADIEVIVSDDASPDASVQIVRGVMATDRRVSLIESSQNRGPAAARNAALHVARGEWIAIVDSDDLVHPERFERLLATARDLDADAIADDLLFFSDTPSDAKTLLGNHAAKAPLLVSPEYFVRSAMSDLPSLGYLKPLFRSAALGGITYDESVRIGEDYDFVLRFLLQGNRFYVVPEPLYLYRRHDGSVSHRLSEADVAAMIANHQAFVRSHGPFATAMTAMLQRRLVSLRGSLAFARLVAAAKKRDLVDASLQMARNPSLVLPLLSSVSAHMGRRWGLAPKRSREVGAQQFVLTPAGAAANSNFTLYAALGLRRDALMIEVPPYRSANAAEGIDDATRDLWVQLARAGSRPDAQLVCHGLAGLYASSFLPEKTIRGVVVDEPSEAALALDWIARSPAPLVVSDGVLSVLPRDVSILPLCAGYHAVEAAAVGEAVEHPVATKTRSAKGGHRHGK